MTAGRARRARRGARPPLQGSRRACAPALMLLLLELPARAARRVPLSLARARLRPCFLLQTPQEDGWQRSVRAATTTTSSRRHGAALPLAAHSSRLGTLSQRLRSSTASFHRRARTLSLSRSASLSRLIKAPAPNAQARGRRPISPRLCSPTHRTHGCARSHISCLATTSCHPCLRRTAKPPPR